MRDSAHAAFEGAAEGEMTGYLLECLVDRDFKSRETAYRILAGLGEKAVEPTLQKLNSSDNIHSRKKLAINCDSFYMIWQQTGRGLIGQPDHSSIHRLDALQIMRTQESNRLEVAREAGFKGAVDLIEQVARDFAQRLRLAGQDADGLLRLRADLIGGLLQDLGVVGEHLVEL